VALQQRTTGCESECTACIQVLVQTKLQLNIPKDVRCINHCGKRAMARNRGCSRRLPPCNRKRGFADFDLNAWVADQIDASTTNSAAGEKEDVTCVEQTQQQARRGWHMCGTNSAAGEKGWHMCGTNSAAGEKEVGTCVERNVRLFFREHRE
jgi:hypothetical protein